jgi:hypothetical protein
MPELSDINPFGKFNIGLGTLGDALLLFFLGIVIVGLIGWLIYWYISKRQYFIKIPLFRLVGNVPTRVETYLARKFPIGKAGDCLWYAKGIKKFLAPATIQSAPDEFWHWEREDGEWINFAMADLDKHQKQAGIRYIHQDMRSQRIATANLLEQRLINKSFWDKYKDLIVQLVFYIITTLMLVVIFWQWSNMVDKMSSIATALADATTKLDNLECVGIRNPLIPATTVTAFFPLLFWRKKK